MALDGSAESETILGHLEGLLPPRCVILLIHVIPAPPPSSEQQLFGLLRLEEDAERYLQEVQARFPRFRSRWILESGDPAQRILDAARDEDVDALALTSRARGALRSLLMGSVAQEVLQRAGRPVFLVHPRLPPPRTPRKILVPLSGPEGAESLLRAVEPLAKQADSQVILLHVLPFPRVADPVTGFNPIVLQPLRLPEAAWLDAAVDLLDRHGVRAEKRVLAGEPDEVLQREIREEEVGLIALRTRGRGGVARLVLGSVADHVVRTADRLVLLLHRVED